MKSKNYLYLFLVTAVCTQWIVLNQLYGHHLPVPFNAISPGLAIFAAAFMLSWGAELAQLELPRTIALSFLALIAVLPEYAVDMYFAWKAAEDPQYAHFALANMTGANRIIIGVGWSLVVLIYYLKFKKGEVHLDQTNRIEIFALTVATLYSFVIPFKQNISIIDTIVLVGIFIWYIMHAMKVPHDEPHIEGPIKPMAEWPRAQRVFMTLLFFAFAGYTIYIAAEPFAQGLIHMGRNWGIEEFMLVQWIAPLASESPEFIVAIIFVLRMQPQTALSALVSSKVNQWTLLVGLLPVVYSISAGEISALHFDHRQVGELFLTSAQSVFAIVVIANLRFSITEALIIFGLFISQIFFPSTEVHMAYAWLYILLAAGWLFAVKGNREGFRLTLKKGFSWPRKSLE